VTTASIGPFALGGKSARIVSDTTRLSVPAGSARSSTPPNWAFAKGSARNTSTAVTTTV
jgi:hypothetical protein